MEPAVFFGGYFIGALVFHFVRLFFFKQIRCDWHCSSGCPCMILPTVFWPIALAAGPVILMNMYLPSLKEIKEAQAKKKLLSDQESEKIIKELYGE